MKLSIPRHIYDEMVSHCLDELPNEGCGFLGGGDGEVKVIYKLDNAAASPVYYRPNDKQMLAALKDIDDKDITLVGIFHSHVMSPPFPSPTDVREAHHADAAYVIVTLADRDSPATRAFKVIKEDWRDEKGEIEEIDLVVS